MCTGSIWRLRYSVYIYPCLLLLCTINRKINGTPKLYTCPFWSYIQFIRSEFTCPQWLMVKLLWASKFATAKIEYSFEMGKWTALRVYGSHGSIYFAVDGRLKYEVYTIIFCSIYLCQLAIGLVIYSFLIKIKMLTTYFVKLAFILICWKKIILFFKRNWIFIIFHKKWLSWISIVCSRFIITCVHIINMNFCKCFLFIFPQSQ